MPDSVMVQWSECETRAREVPALLRSLARFDDGAESAQSLCDELLADVDGLLCRVLREGDLDLAGRLVKLKWGTYAVLRPFLRASGWSEGALWGFERSAMEDLEDSQRRVEIVEQRAEGVQFFTRLAGAA